MIFEMENKFTMDMFLKTLPNAKKSKVYDFDKITAAGFPIHLIMTQRGALGKSFNAKLHFYKKYKELNEPTVWLMNTAKQIKKEKGKFLKDMIKSSVAYTLGSEQEEWKKMKPKGNPDDLDTRITDPSNKTIFELVALSQAEYYKGARDKVYAICFDEFNAGSERVPLYIEKYDSLLHSYEDVVNDGYPPKLFYFGNSKSLAHPLIFRLGITKIDKEITTFYTDNGDPFLIVFAPQIDEEEAAEIEEKNKHNPFYHLSNQLGTGDHAYKNKSLFDDMNFVNPYFTGDGKDKLLVEAYNVIFEKQTYTIYFHGKGVTRGSVPHYHIRAVLTPDKNALTICFNRKDITEGVVLRKDVQTNLIKQTISSNVQFEDTMSRVLFINSLR